MFYIIASFSTFFFLSLKNWDFIQILKVKLSIELKGCFVSICITSLMFFKASMYTNNGTSQLQGSLAGHSQSSLHSSKLC